jgi:predicted RNA binding protein YcfA (HicA-like mRNA interferase family)
MSVRLPEVRPRELERVVLRLGYQFARSRGSHRIYKHPGDPTRRVVLSFHPGTVKRGTLARIVRDLGISVEEFLALL